MTTRDLAQPTPQAPIRELLCTVPEATVYFWIIKILTTGMGEAAADFMTRTIGPLIAVGLSGGAVAQHRRAGLGTGLVSLGLTVVILGFVAYLSVVRRGINTAGNPPL